MLCRPEKRKSQKKEQRKTAEHYPKKRRHQIASTGQNTVKALHESQKRLSLALDSAHIGIWDWNIKSNSLWLSDTVHKIFGTSKRTFDGTMESLRR
jgi:PAS domain-containing protein